MSNLKQVLNLLKFSRGSTRPISGPAKACWEVTYQCNSDCRGCSRRKNDPNRKILSTEEGKNLISELGKLNVLSLNLSGGEPMLREDIFELIYHAKKNTSMSITMSSNGLLINNEKLIKLSKAGLDIIYLSLDGANSANHDDRRGIKGNFDKTLKVIDIIRSHRIKDRPKIFINTVVTKKNLEELSEIAVLSEKQGVEGMSFQLFEKCEEKEYFGDDELEISPKDAENLRDAVINLLKNHKKLIPVSEEYLDRFSDYIQDSRMVYEYRCVAGYAYCLIDAYGEVFPCTTKYKSMGNLRDMSFKDLWFSNDSKNLRDEIKLDKHPPCWFNCIAPMNIAMSNVSLTKFHKLLKPKFMKHIILKAFSKDIN